MLNIEKKHPFFPSNSSESSTIDDIKKARIKEQWKYKDYSYQQWTDNGFLLTKDRIPSKLDQETYNLVRSKEFKEWFGDWENQPDKASKMIDEDTGEPMVFYRGDKSLYKDAFLIRPEDERTPQSDRSNEPEEALKRLARNQGVFFTDNKKVALAYGRDINAVTLGKYGVDCQKDHPKTFKKMKNWLISFANQDLNFWNKILDSYVCNSGLKDEFYKRNFDLYMIRNGFSRDDADSLWKELRFNIRRNKPEYYINLFIEKNMFDDLIKGFMSQAFKDPDELFSPETRKKWYIFGSEKTPEWSQQFKRLALEYFSEPLALSTVFIRSYNPKVGKLVDINDRPDVFNARLDGHDSYVNQNAVGNSTDGVIGGADEVVVFDLNNIWVVKKEPLGPLILSEYDQSI
ncbi:MAG: hypothetical protein GF347_00850 [Candidatus Moranbacteria bacterium]|nr:hypothetical protein [Candidatus Moranbacteria bacterium]